MRVQEITAGQSVKFRTKEGKVAYVIPADGYSPARVVVQWADNDRDTFHASELNPAY